MGEKAEIRLRRRERLRDRLRFERLLARLSATFVHLPPERVDAQIELGLRQIVEYLDLDRSSLAECVDGHAYLVTHSYAVNGIAPYPLTIADDQLPWFIGRLRRGKVVRLGRLPDDLPAAAVAERAYCHREGVKATLAVPLALGDTPVGLLTMSSFRRHQSWPPEVVRSVQLMGHVFANALGRRRAEEQRRQVDERLRLLLETTHAVPWVAEDRLSRITYVGPQAVALLGFPVQAWYADRFWVDHIHPDDRALAVAECQRTQGEVGNFQFEYRMTRADGSTAWVHEVVSITAGSTGALERRGFMIDVTERRRAEEESRVFRDQLVRVGRASLLGELAASIAHEVNQPLCAIVSNAEALRRMITAGTGDAAELRAAIDDVARDGARAGAILARIRGFLAKSPPQSERLEVNGLIVEVAALARHDLARRGIDLQLNLADRLPPVQGDRIQLQQVVLNLLTNASEASHSVAEPMRRLEISSVIDAPGRVHVAVCDQGSGIPDEDLGRVFEPFFTSKPGSMGMGLAICRSIITAHGGQIWAERAPVRGTTVRFILPAELADPP